MELTREELVATCRNMDTSFIQARLSADDLTDVARSVAIEELARRERENATTVPTPVDNSAESSGTPDSAPAGVARETRAGNTSAAESRSTGETGKMSEQGAS